MKKTNSWTNKIREHGSFRHFYRIYIIAFAFIALIAIISQLLIQNYLGKQSEDSYLINVAGKQRMLSQKITKNLSFYAHDTSNISYSNSVRIDVAYWSKKQALLSSGELIKSTYNTTSIQKKYSAMESFFKDLKSDALSFLDDPRPEYLDRIHSNEQEYLRIMDSIVDEYDHNYISKITLLRRIEFGLALVLLVILFIEMFFVFLPLIKMLQKVFHNLLSSERSANDLADNLNRTNEQLEERNKEINDSNLALDKAVILIKIDPSGGILYANQKYCDIAKYSLFDLMGKSLFYNNLGTAESIIYKHIKHESKKYEVWQGEVHDTASDSSDFWLDVTIFPIVNTEGKLYEYLVICNDITKRKLTEQEIKLLNEKKFLRQEEEQIIKSKSIIEGQEVERKRMAVEVHDGLGQMLTALKFTCEAVDPANDTQEQIFSNMKELLHDVIVETRRISSDLLPTVLSDFGLEAGLKELLTNASRISDQVSFTYKNEASLIERLSNDKEIAAYRITQEAINNSLKHSDAKAIEVKISNDAEFLYVAVSDDGKGLKNNSLLEDTKEVGTGNGLRNMKERARLVEGNIYINSSLNKGTQVFLEIPID